MSPPPTPPPGGVSRRRRSQQAAAARSYKPTEQDNGASPPPPRQGVSVARVVSPPRSIIAGQPEERRTFVVSLSQNAHGDYGVNLDEHAPSARRAVVVTAVAFGSTAALAGVLPGDELLAIAGYGVEPGALQKALAHLRIEEQRLQQLHGERAVDVDWRFYRPAGPLPQLPRTKSPVRFSPARVRTFKVSPREEEEKRKHWHAIHGASHQQYVQQEQEERGEQHLSGSTSPFQLHPTGTALEKLYTSAAVAIQRRERGRQQRVCFSANEARAARQRAALKLQSARRGQIARRCVEESKQAKALAVKANDPERSAGHAGASTKPSLRLSSSARAAAVAAAAEADEAALAAELKRARHKFAEIDADRSGKLTRDEVAALARWALESFVKSERADINTVQMTPEQLDGATTKLLSQADADGDGQLSFAEFAAWFTPTCQEIQAFRHKQEMLRRQKRAQKRDARPFPRVPADVNAREHAAATKLQAVVRGRQDRLRHKRRLRAQRRREEAAATKVSACYRGHLARKSAQRNAAATQALGRCAEGSRQRDLTLLPGALPQNKRQPEPEPEPEPEPGTARVHQMVARIYEFCDPDNNGWIGQDEYMYCKHSSSSFPCRVDCRADVVTYPCGGLLYRPRRNQRVGHRQLHTGELRPAVVEGVHCAGLRSCPWDNLACVQEYTVRMLPALLHK